MSEMTLDRRRFLQGAGSLLMGTLLFVNGRWRWPRRRAAGRCR